MGAPSTVWTVATAGSEQETPWHPCSCQSSASGALCALFVECHYVMPAGLTGNASPHWQVARACDGNWSLLGCVCGRGGYCSCSLLLSTSARSDGCLAWPPWIMTLSGPACPVYHAALTLQQYQNGTLQQNHHRHHHHQTETLFQHLSPH